jgi:hypothetical protein
MKVKILFSIILSVTFSTSLAAQDQELVLITTTPCVVFDTRPAFGGTGAFAVEEERTFHIAGSTAPFAAQGGTAGGCGVPGFSGGNAGAQAVFINYIAIEPQGSGQLKAWAADKTEPPQGALVNYQALTPPMNNSNAVVTELRLDAEGNDIKVKAKSAGVHVRGVILGYFKAGHKHAGEDVVSGTVAAARIDSAIARDNEILSTVLAGDGMGSGLDADYLDGLNSGSFASYDHDHDSVYEKKYGKIILIRDSGSSLNNGATLRNAMLGVFSGPGIRYLIKLEPGIFDLGDFNLVGKPYVDIEGSGEGVTVITRTGAPIDSPLLVAASLQEVRHLTIDYSGGGTTTAVGCDATYPSPKLSHVTINVSGPTSNIGFETANTGVPVLHEVAIRVNGSGSASSWGILIGTGSSLDVRGGSVLVTSGAFAAAVNSKGHLKMQRTSISIAFGSNTNVGIDQDGGSLQLRGVNLAVSGAGTSAYGMKIFGTPSVSIVDTDLSVFGSAASYGIDASSDANLLLRNVVVGASGGSSPTAIRLTSAFATIDRSSLRSNPTCVELIGTAHVRIGASRVDGAVVRPVPLAATCAASYTDGMDRLGRDCLPEFD